MTEVGPPKPDAASTFNLFQEDTRTKVLDWLSSRYQTAQDRHVEDTVQPVAVLIPGSIGGLHFLPQLWPAWRATQAHRTTPRRIGLYECDEAAMVNRRFVYSLGLRALFATAIGAVSAGIGLGWPAVVSVVVTVWAVSGWITPMAWLATVLAGTAVAITGGREVAGAGMLTAAALAALGCRRLLALAETGMRVYGRTSSDPVRFLGRWILVRAMWSRTTASLVLAVDKATHDDLARARLFLDDCRATIPAKWAAIPRQCEALLQARDLHLQLALTLSHEASDLAAGAPRAIRGWCALHFGDVLLAAGNSEAAEEKWQQAASLLAHSRGRFWRVQADLRLARALTGDVTHTDRVVEGLQAICRLRMRAVRSVDFGMLQRTEYLLLRLMHQAGNADGVRRQLTGTPIWQLKADKVLIGTSVGEHAMKLLLKASPTLDAADDSDPGPSQGQLSEAAELISAALRHLIRTRDPLLLATAYAALARIQLAQDHRQDALASALESLQAIQRVRYQLPTTSWRASWVRAHRHVYTLALDLACDDPALVGELLEVVRSQAVPLERDEPGTWTRSKLDALVASFALPGRFPSPNPTDSSTPSTLKGVQPADQQSVEASPPVPSAPASADPLIADQTILVQRASWIGGDSDAAIDVDEELDLMFPGAWYWSLARAGSWVYHAIRGPDGNWSGERRRYDDLSPALDELLRHLPVRLPGEITLEHKARLEGTALRAETADQTTSDNLSAGEGWRRIFDHLGEVLIPSVLRSQLSCAADQPARLVIAPTGTLALVPFAAVSLVPGTPLIDHAVLTHLPSIALLSARRQSAAHNTDAEHADPGSRVLAVLAPHLPTRFTRMQDVYVDTSADLWWALQSAPGASCSHRGRLSKSEFAAIVGKESASGTVLYLAGHVDASPSDDPAGTGFRFYNEDHLTLRDLYKVDDYKRPVYRIPHRVLLSGCASLGLYSEATAGEDQPFAAEPEWLGLGAAMVFGGAEHVYCTLFTVADSPYSVRIDQALIDAMRHAIDPAQALRVVQRAEIRRWRRGDRAMPTVFLAYVYVGVGAAS